jgi:predicted Rossmann fold flavoprotein
VNSHPIVVVGGGPSGMMAAGRAAEMGCRIILLERMPRLGSKLSITGKGRCNITNMEEMDSFLEHYGKSGNFLRNCFARFFNRDLIHFFQNRGVETVIERGKRVFPESSDADEIIHCMDAFLRDNGVKVRTGFKVDAILSAKGHITGIRGEGEEIPCNIAIVATGGISYPLTGSTGDGYRFAQDLGHRVRKPEPGLVPIEIRDDFVTKMQGLGLKNVELSAFADGKIFARLFGEMIFTHFGISGPIVLTMSHEIVKRLRTSKVVVSVNFKPALSKDTVEKRLLREFDTHGKMRCRNVLKQLLPVAAIDVFIERSGILPHKRASEVTRDERQRLVQLLTDFRMIVKGPRPIDEAIVTEGGIALDEIDPYTMQSRIVKGLFFCGEVIDIAGDTGGYNLQAAFSTGYIAGESACSVSRAL